MRSGSVFWFRTIIGTAAWLAAMLVGAAVSGEAPTDPRPGQIKALLENQGLKVLSVDFAPAKGTAPPVWAAGTAAALTEAALAIGFWIRPLRVPTALLGAAFHGALTSIVQIGFLDWVSLFLYSAFLLPFTASVPAASGLPPPVPPPPRRAGARAVSGDGDAGDAAPLPDSGIIPI